MKSYTVSWHFNGKSEFKKFDTLTSAIAFYTGMLANGYDAGLHEVDPLIEKRFVDNFIANRN